MAAHPQDLTVSQNYASFGSFPGVTPIADSSYPVLTASMANDADGVMDHYIDIDDNSRSSNDVDPYPTSLAGVPYLLHRGHVKGYSGNSHPNYVFIHYWMYSTASHSPYHTTIASLNNKFTHEADWEMVQIAVRLKDSALPDNKADWILPWAATASQHFYGQTLAWRLDHPNEASSVTGQRYVRTSDTDPNRIKIYIAENSHATYFRDGIIDADIADGVGTQTQYDADYEEYFDRISGAELLDDSDLLPLEKKNQTGIYDWPGRWGEQAFNPMVPVLPGPLYREAWDAQLSEGKFRLDSDPVRFHNRCRKKINGSVDPETELK